METVVKGHKYILKQCEVVRLEDEFGHSYMIDDEPVAGVTTLLSLGMPADQGLLEYFKRTSKEEQENILLDAQERGSNVHQAIEMLLLGEKINSGDFSRKREKLGVAAFVHFFQTVKITDIFPEQVVAYLNGEVKFAGTMDLVCVIPNGKRIIIDFKTSATHSRKNELQVIAYKEAYEQSTGLKVDDCYVLYLGSTHKGTRPKMDDNDLPSNGIGWFMVKANCDFVDFMRAYDTALFMNNGKYPKPPKVFEFPDKWQILQPKKGKN